MRIVLQKVSSAAVFVAEKKLGQIKAGFLLLVGIEDTDDEKTVDYLVHKIVFLRVFADENDKMNLSIKDVGGAILSISQFTLYADTKKGNRPSFTKAGQPQHAERIYDLLNKKLAHENLSVQTGEFGAHMQVELVNDGPVTIMFDTDES
ncbi:D-tyrosyl-tRNA(Tyr) deacylase [Oenococcus sicerae]|uniref:D-aminoacyl-tRNA deacylase n=1 Tax=Oenococcus sicerae TaxID=2203724 RepID=A0AAJ1RC44_9LACO|nr:D-aminoacyl-tRNA deacylase [Oenococcus sicerae]MDN6900027.1 D-tyrosyl-tRNA(Tyr) deacylase [Oenococcus sicerae]QAS69637.1 D-tyrosyl-tRNA(Tyr) deacylase [Oenococcus sicerae]